MTEDKQINEEAVSPQGVFYSELDHLMNADGLHLFKKAWKPDTVRAVVLVLHGVSEHCLRYQRLADQLNPAEIAVYAHDHVGHGQSEGTRADIKDFNIFVRDALQHADIIREEHPDIPFFLFGHSMGGTVAILTAMERPTFFTGAIMSGPAIEPDPASVTPFKKFMAKSVAHILPQMSVGNLPIDKISRDLSEVEKYKNDSLVYHGGVKSRIAVQILNAMNKIKHNMSDVEWPFLLMHGTEDKLALFAGSKAFAENAKSSDKKFKEYNGYYHELINEPEEDRNTVLKDILDWINERI